MNQEYKDIFSKVPVKDLIPHEDPFIMVDQLLDYSDKKVIAGITVKAENIFTKNNIFTEPGLIEHMAQSVALHTGCQYKLKNQPAPKGYIGSINKVEIKKLPKLGQNIITTVSILHEIMGVTLVNIVTKLNDVEIAKGQMKTVIAK